MQVYDFKVLLDELHKKMKIVEHKTQDIDKTIREIVASQEDPKFWQDIESVTATNKKLKFYQKKQSSINELKKAIADFEAGITLSEEEPDFFNEGDLKSLYNNAQALLDSVWIETLMTGKYDSGSAVIMVHSGAGGEEAQDWAEMISRMYTRYAERVGYSVTLLDSTPGDGAGIKSETYLVDGDFAYGYLKTEKGVHRLVRLSPFDANNRRHTSFASLEVSPFVDNAVGDIEIKDSDIKIDTFRSSGAGGQHVNKTESAIRITHIPTGIVVTCQNERSQTQNKEMAMKLLISKLTERKLAEEEKLRLERLKENKKIEWGSQIRSYVLHPYSLAKDHRTGFETSNVQGVLDGDLQPFINEYLRITDNE